MRSFLLVLSVLALIQLSSAAQIKSVTFYNDSACATNALNVATAYGLSESSQWPSLNSSSVYDQESAPCANVNFGTIQSGTYSCLSGETGVNATGGMLVYEYNQANCAGAPAVIYVFYGAPNATTCIPGDIEIISSTGATSYPTWANVVCTNITASTATSSSSASAPVTSSSSSSSSTGTLPGGNGAAERVSVLGALFAVVVVAMLASL